MGVVFWFCLHCCAAPLIKACSLYLYLCGYSRALLTSGIILFLKLSHNYFDIFAAVAILFCISVVRVLRLFHVRTDVFVASTLKASYLQIAQCNDCLSVHVPCVEYKCIGPRRQESGLSLLDTCYMRMAALEKIAVLHYQAENAWLLRVCEFELWWCIPLLAQ